jgi:hypothetical protein
MWFEWATGNGGELYQELDLPYIVSAYRDCWDVSIPASSSVSNLPASISRQVKNEIILLLEISGLIPPQEDPSIMKRISSHKKRKYH